MTLLRQTTEFHQCRGVRCLLAIEVDTHETTNCPVIIDRVLDAFIRQAKALLGDVNAQYARQSDRRPAPSTFGLNGSISSCKCDRGVTLSVFARKMSRRVSFLLAAYSRSEKLFSMINCAVMNVPLLSQVLQSTGTGPGRINQRFPSAQPAFSVHPQCCGSRRMLIKRRKRRQ